VALRLRAPVPPDPGANFSPTMMTAPRMSGRAAIHSRAGAMVSGPAPGCRERWPRHRPGGAFGQNTGGVRPAEAQGMPHAGRGGAHPRGLRLGSRFSPTRWLKGICRQTGHGGRLVNGQKMSPPFSTMTSGLKGASCRPPGPPGPCHRGHGTHPGRRGLDHLPDHRRGERSAGQG